MTYTIWGKDDEEFTLAPGDRQPPGDTPGMTPLHQFEADSWDDAVRYYHEWHGWEPHKPIETS